MNLTALVETKDAVLLALIAMIPLLAAQLPAIILSVRNGRKLDESKKVQKDIHTLVNSQRGETLRTGAAAARALAVAEPSYKNLSLAETAEKEYADHLNQQSIVDTRQKLESLEANQKGG